MTYQFPTTPTVGQTVIGPTGIPYTWDGEKWVVASTGSAMLFLPLVGGTMEGPITLESDATQNLQPTTFEQMNAADTTLQNNINAVWGTGGLAGGFVNKLRNPGMDIWQRGNVTVTSGSTVYTADGWLVTAAGAACAVTLGKDVGISNSALVLAAASGLTTVNLQQRIESLVAAPLAGQTCTFQARIINNTSAPITPLLATFYFATADTASTITTDISVTLQTIPAGANVIVAYTFTASANARNGYGVVFGFGGSLNATTGSVAITDCDLRVTPGVTIGLNNSPPPVELRPIAIEMVNCLRYYYASVVAAYGTWFISSVTSGSNYWAKGRYPTPMRTVPSLVLTNASSNGFPTTAGATSQITVEAFLETRTCSTTLSNGFFGSSFTASAEL